MPIDHYENFPVASLLLPAHLRAPVEAIYAFARSADDLADEGDAPPQQRLTALAAYRAALESIRRGEQQADPLFARLQSMIHAWNLPVDLFADLLSAFSQDVHTLRYPTFAALRDYCRRSADPVGRLLLHLYRHTSPTDRVQSDCICTSLQLINFWQDVAVDWRKSRIYLPEEDLQRFGVTEAHIAEGRVDRAWCRLLAFEVQRARTMMLAGAPLALRLPGRIGWELRLVVAGGLRILQRMEAAGYDVFRHRPTLGKTDGPPMLWTALRLQRLATPR